jgi:hypothetical protein
VLDRDLPYLEILFCLWQFGDVGRGVPERDKLPAVGQDDLIVELAGPFRSASGVSPLYRISTRVPAGGLGGLLRSLGLQRSQGMPAAPQPQAWSPSQGFPGVVFAHPTAVATGGAGRHQRSPGHHVVGGLNADIFVDLSATRWLRLNGRPLCREQSLQRM